MIKKPAARRQTLTLVAGAVWSITGLFLGSVAVIWTLPESLVIVILYVSCGLLMGWFIYRFKFRQIASLNLERIFVQSPGQEKVCVFAFQNLRSYLLVIIMMAMGYLVRHSGIPKPYLAPFYLAIGAAMLLSSLVYFRHILKLPHA